MNTDMFYLLGGLLLLLAGLVYLAFLTWLSFCRSLARMPGGDVLFGQAPKIIEAFDVKTWGAVFLPWDIIGKLIRWLASRFRGTEPPKDTPSDPESPGNAPSDPDSPGHPPTDP